MNLFEKLEKFNTSHHPLILTIGNFDGMHRGHCAVLKKVKELAGETGETVVITFNNHPSEVLRPEHPIKLLSTLKHKLKLLDEFGIQNVVLLPFTRYLAQHTAASFIENVRQFIPFTDLVLGYDATLGRDRRGDRATMQQLGEEWGFHVQYLEEYRFEAIPVSSSRIRDLLQKGELNQVNELLDRPYSILASVIHGEGKGKELGFPTANLEVDKLCLPPLGVYAIEAQINSKHYPGIANLGLAPTVRNDPAPLLEVHLFDNNQQLYGEEIEVFFKAFIRPEKKFANLEELKTQIRQDIERVKTTLQN